MRYFVCTSAGRPYVVGGQTFTFEPVGYRGGSQFGILAVDDESAASALANSEIPVIGEISEERYNEEKKKELAGPTPSTSSLPVPTVAPVSLKTAEPAEPSTPLPSSELPAIEPDMLDTTAEIPPFEPLLEQKKKHRKPITV